MRGWMVLALARENAMARKEIALVARIALAAIALVLILIVAAVACGPGDATDSDPAGTLATATAIAVTGPPTLRSGNPRPSVLRKVIPGPGDSLSLHEYIAGHHGLGTWFGQAGAKICAEVGPFGFENPDNLGAEIDERMDLWVDDQGREISGEIQVVTSLEQRLNEEGTPVSQSTGPVFLCWVADLEAGIHVVKWSFRTITGRSFGYEWSFELTEE